MGVFLLSTLLGCSSGGGGQPNPPAYNPPDAIVHGPCGGIQVWVNECWKTWPKDNLLILRELKQICKMGEEYGITPNMAKYKLYGIADPYGGTIRANGVWRGGGVIDYRCGYGSVLAHEITCHDPQWDLGCECDDPHVKEWNCSR